MSGIALVVDARMTPGSDEPLRPLAADVARLRHASEPPAVATGHGCAVAKLDAPTARHRGIVTDEATGSWLAVAGTLVDDDGPPDRPGLERLLADVLSDGPSRLAACDGQFVAVVYDGRQGAVTVATDPLGYLAAYEGSRDGRRFVATSALAVARAVGAPLDRAAAACFLRTGKLFGPQTLWTGVRRLAAATTLTYGTDATRETTYWEPRLQEHVAGLPFDDAVDLARQEIEAALRRVTRGEPGLWTDLTGGFDTRLLVAHLARIEAPFQANVVGPPTHPDVHIARRLARAMGWPCTHFELPADWSETAGSRISPALGHADGHLDVLQALRPLWVHEQEGRVHSLLLSGMGGEMWRGPGWWPERGALGRTTTMHYDRQTWSVMHPVDESVIAAPNRDAVRAALAEQLRAAGEREPAWPNTAKLDRVWLFREAAHAGSWLSLGPGLIRIATPLFSTRVVELAMSMRPEWRSGNRVVRHLFARLARPLADVEIEGRGPAGPLRPANAHRFAVASLRRGRRALDKAAQIVAGRRLWTPSVDPGFDRRAFRASVLDALEREGALPVDRLASSRLYHRRPLEALLAGARREPFDQTDLLGRIVSIELTLRASGSWVD